MPQAWGIPCTVAGNQKGNAMHTSTFETVLTILVSILCVANFVLGNLWVASFMLAVLVFNAVLDAFH